MKDNRLIVGFDTVAEVLFQRQAKEKMKVLNEAVKLAEPNLKKIDRLQFSKGFSHYVFTEMLKNEPEGKRDRISKEEYCKLYSVPLNELNALEAKYKAIGGLQLSGCGTYFLIPDFNIYLTTEKQIQTYEAVKRLCKMLTFDFKGLYLESLLIQSMRHLLTKDSEGRLIPDINMIKRVK